MKITEAHQELFEQIIIVTMAVLGEKEDGASQVDIEDFIEWFKDTYMEEDIDLKLASDIALHHIREDMNKILNMLKNIERS